MSDLARQAGKVAVSSAFVAGYLALGVVIALGAAAGAAGVRHYSKTLLTTPPTFIQLERRANERDRRCEWWSEMYQTTCLPTLPQNR